MPDKVVELRAISQHAEDDSAGEAGVAGIESRGVGEQQIGGIAAGFHLAEDVEGGGAGGGGHGWLVRMWPMARGRDWPRPYKDDMQEPRMPGPKR